MRRLTLLVPLCLPLMAGCSESRDEMQLDRSVRASQEGPAPVGSGNWAAALGGGAPRPDRVRKWQAHEGAVTAIAVSSRGDLVLSVGYDDYGLRLWDRETGTLIDGVKLEGRPRDLTLIPGEDRIAVCLANTDVVMHSFTRGGLGDPVQLRGGAEHAFSISASRDGRTLAATTFRGPVLLWNLEDRTGSGTLDKSISMRGIAFSPTQDLLAAGSMGNTFTLWKLQGSRSGKRHEVKIPKVSDQSDVASVAFSPDGKRLLTGHMDSSFTVWDVRKRKQLLNQYVQDASTLDVAWGWDGSLFATAQANGRVFLWDPDTGVDLASLGGHEGGATAVAFSPVEWEILFSGDEKGRIHLWQ